MRANATGGPDWSSSPYRRRRATFKRSAGLDLPARRRTWSSAASGVFSSSPPSSSSVRLTGELDVAAL
eukprot:8344067-Pyramimonas_sp.AAC.1